MTKVELNIIALANSESHPGNFVLILEDVSGFRRLPIVIGASEAQSIAVTLERMQPARPLTHDLFTRTLRTLGVSLKEICITRFESEIFYASLLLHDKDKRPLELDARTSDAIALAVRFECPIYIAAEVLEKTGVAIDQSKSFAFKRGSLYEYSVEELEKLLENVLAKEDYESATRIRNVLAKKKGHT
jgi:uncharacterized protein